MLKNLIGHQQLQTYLMIASFSGSLLADQQVLVVHYSQLKGHPFEPTKQWNAANGIITYVVHKQ